MNRSVKRLALATVAAAVLCIGPASSALAAVPAIWTPQGSMKQAGTLKIEYNGEAAVTCQMKAEGTTQSDFFYTAAIASHSCSNGGKLGFTFLQLGQKEGTNYQVLFGGSGLSYIHPWGGFYKQEQFVVPFTNGSGTKMSTLHFNNTKIGREIPGPYITATGTITVTTGAGGLITLK